jgi:hypothetical protein
MARRRKGAQPVSRRGREKDPPDYYAKAESDTSYIQTAHLRARQKALRQWLIRLAVVLAVLIGWHFWGATLVQLAKGKEQAAVQNVKGVGQKIQRGRDERTGANFDENSR